MQTIKINSELETIDVKVPEEHIIGQFAVHHSYVEFPDKSRGFDQKSYSVTHIPSGLRAPNECSSLEIALDLASTLANVDKSIINRAVKGNKKAYKELSRIYKEWLEG